MIYTKEKKELKFSARNADKINKEIINMTYYQLENLGIAKNDGENITLKNGMVFTAIDNFHYTRVK